MPEPTHSPAVVHHPVPLRPLAQHPVVPAPPATLPTVASVRLPDGRIATGYTLTPLPAPPAPAHPGGPVPAWAKTTALLAPTVGGGIAAAGFGISYAAPGVLAMADALWALVALIAAGSALPLLLRASRSRSDRGAVPVQHITQHVSATGLFGKATGTLNHR